MPSVVVAVLVYRHGTGGGQGSLGTGETILTFLGQRPNWIQKDPSSLLREDPPVGGRGAFRQINGLFSASSLTSLTFL